MTAQSPARSSLHKQKLEPEKVLRQLLSPDGGIYASGDVLYKFAIFGRDSLEVAEDLLAFKPNLVKQIILNVARLQGTKYDLKSEEEPGRIHHEHRHKHLNGATINARSKRILKELSAKWGGGPESFIYYGSVDATPLFIRLINRYCYAHGTNLLKEKLLDKNERLITLNESLERAVEWLVRRLEASDLGLLESLPTNPQGITYQFWKDSDEFYTHPNGERVNHNQPVASIEVQGLAYDALQAAMEHFPRQKRRFARLNEKLQQTVLNKLWLEGENYFGLGFDRTKSGKPRVIRAITANPAALLDTAIFDNLPKAQRQRYLSGIVKAIFGSDFLTNAGIRSRALRHQYLIPFWDYHGSFAVWPKETYDIAHGLRRQGFPRLARQLENRLLNVIAISGGFPELVYVDASGHVLFGPPSKLAIKPIRAVTTNRPEKIQSWTVSALLGSLRTRKGRVKTSAWQAKLQKLILNSISLIPRLRSTIELAAYYPRYHYRLQRPPNYQSALRIKDISYKKLPYLLALGELGTRLITLAKLPK